jgi:hypothetical protein
VPGYQLFHTDLFVGAGGCLCTFGPVSVSGGVVNLFDNIFFDLGATVVLGRAPVYNTIVSINIINKHTERWSRDVHDVNVDELFRRALGDIVILRKHFFFYQPQLFHEFFEHFSSSLFTKYFKLQDENFVKM